MATIYNASNYLYEMKPPVIALVDTHLWKMFNSVGTEMIITKNGRKLFPTIKIRLYDLDPNAEYDVAMHMKISRNCRLKFQAKSGWKEAGACDPKGSKDLYVHFESGKTGYELMAKPLSFEKIRVTNSLPAALSANGSMEKYNDFICLNSMHEYLPTVILTMRTPYGKRSFCYPLELTKFVAVTAYQNQQVTEIKINENPYAKGFRADGQAKKRKSKGDSDNSDESDQKISKLNTSSSSSSSSFCDEMSERLSPYEPLPESMIPPWGIRQNHGFISHPYAIPHQSLIPHFPNGEFLHGYYPRRASIPLSSPSVCSDVDVESLSSESIALSPRETDSNCNSKRDTTKGESSKIAFSIHRILYEL